MMARTLSVALLLLFFSLPSKLFAEKADLEACLESQGQTEISLLQLLEDTKEIWSGCPSDNQIFLDEAKEQYEALYPNSSQRSSDYIEGINLIGTDEELEFMRKILGNTIHPNWPKVAAGCDTARCALSKLFGSEEAGYRLLSIPKYSGYIVSADQQLNPKNKPQLFSPSEIRTMDKAIRKLPPSMLHMPGLKNIYRVTDGHRHHSHGATTAAYADKFNESIVAYEGCLSGNNQTNIIHEIAHHHDFKNADFFSIYFSSNESWRNLSGWDTGSTSLNINNGTIEKKYSHRENKQFVRDYAATNPAEDYAESIAYYIENGSYLKTLDPEKYAFLKKHVFEGKEYLEDVTVPGLKEYVNQHAPAINAECLRALSGLDEGNTWKSKNRYHFYYDQFLKACAEKQIASMVTNFPDKKALCLAGGADAIIRQLAPYENHMKKVKASLLWAIDQSHVRAKDRCLARKDISLACRLAESRVQNPHIQSLEKDLGIEATNQMLEGILQADLLSGPYATDPSVKAVQETIPYSLIYFYCLKDATLLGDKNGTVYIKSGPQKYTSLNLLSYDRQCLMNATKALEADGYTFTRGTERIVDGLYLGKSHHIKDLQSALNTAVSNAKQCRGSGRKLKSCQTKAIEKHLTEWAKEHGNIRPELVQEISESVTLQ